MTAKQIVGWFLLSMGVLLIAWTLYSSWQIFTGKAAAPEIFKVASSVAAKRPQGGGTKDLQAQAQELVSQTLKEQLQQFLPIDYTPKLLNLFSWSIFAGILLFGGGQIAGMGIKLLS